MNEQGGEPTKVPPHNIEAEQSIIGGILLDNEVLPSVLEVLRGEEYHLCSGGRAVREERALRPGYAD
jgi:hypothetical protein